MHDLLSNQLELLNQNDKMLNDLYHHYAASWKLSDTALWIIYILWIHDGGLTQKELCQLWFYSKQTINTCLKKLEIQGYIQLDPVSGNRKSKQIVFTDIGKKHAKKIVPPLLDAERVSFSRLNERERADLTFLMQKRTELFQKEISKTIASISAE